MRNVFSRLLRRVRAALEILGVCREEGAEFFELRLFVDCEGGDGGVEIGPVGEDVVEGGGVPDECQGDGGDGGEGGEV